MLQQIRAGLRAQPISRRIGVVTVTHMVSYFPGVRRCGYTTRARAGRFT
jgi:hypothetical protein